MIKSLDEIFLDEMIEGYRDGFNLDSPEPSQNRSNSYRHGFANGRDDHARSPRATAAMLRLMAEKAIRDDVEASTGCHPPHQPRPQVMRLRRGPPPCGKGSSLVNARHH
jgi:hypothetical protein